MAPLTRSMCENLREDTHGNCAPSQHAIEVYPSSSLHDEMPNIWYGGARVCLGNHKVRSALISWLNVFGFLRLFADCPLTAGFIHHSTPTSGCSSSICTLLSASSKFIDSFYRLLTLSVLLSCTTTAAYLLARPFLLRYFVLFLERECSGRSG